MPSASLVRSVPVPLGRRGTAAAVVLGLHVLLAIALVAGLATRVLPKPDDGQRRVTLLPTPKPVPPPPQRAPSADVPRTTGWVEPRIEIPQFVGPPREAEDGWTVPFVAPTPEPEPLPVEPSTMPRVLKGAEPPYPAVARRMGQEGSVLLRVRVDALGRAEAVEVARTSGYSVLDAAAMNAVRGWRFVPAQAEGRAIAAWVTFTVTFKLTTR